MREKPVLFRAKNLSASIWKSRPNICSLICGYFTARLLHSDFGSSKSKKNLVSSLHLFLSIFYSFLLDVSVTLNSQMWPTITPGLSGFWDQSQVNSVLNTAFWSVEQTDFKNVIVENIHWVLFEDAEVAEVKQPRNSKRRKFYYEKW